MLLSEEEAKTKWCPHVRHPGEGGTFNRGTQHGPLNDHEHNAGTLCNCIASACMAWRWWDGETLSHEPHSEYGAQRIAPDQRRGYCGIAGKPEA
jgi:hypothetical protein